MDKRSTPGFWLVGVVIAVALVWAAYWLWTRQVEVPSGAAEQAGEAAEPVIRESTVEPGQQVLVVQGEWRLRAPEPVRTPLAGRISWSVESGALVEEGELLGRLASGALQAQLGQAQARLNVARHQARTMRQLVAGGYEPQERLTAAEAELEGAQAEFAAAEQAIEPTRIRAPINGRLEILQTSADELPEGAEVGQVLDRDPLFIRIRIPGEQAARLRSGAVARVDLPGVGTVAGRINLLGDSAGKGRALEAEVELPNPNHLEPTASPVEVRLPL